jgi:ArsR family transcriptional regulator
MQKVKLTPEQLTLIARALAEPRRFAILQQIATQAVLPCTALPERHAISPATLSHHIKELQEAGLITAEREGRGMNLSLRRDVWEAYLRALSTL